MDQLTFEILLNPSVKDEDIERLHKQAQEIYHRLENGILTTGDANGIACQYSARINEIRHALVKHGRMIDCVPGDGGNNFFKIVPLNVSTFWKYVIKKSEQWKWLKPR